MLLSLSQKREKMRHEKIKFARFFLPAPRSALARIRVISIFFFVQIRTSFLEVCLKSLRKIFQEWRIRCGNAHTPRSLISPFELIK